MTHYDEDGDSMDNNANTRTDRPTTSQLYAVAYHYDGGSGREIVSADSAEAAAAAVLAAARPRWARDPSTPCHLQGVHRVLFAPEIEHSPNYGLARAYDRTWDQRDRGQQWLVVERGHRQWEVPGVGLRDCYSDSGVVVGGRNTQSRARSLASTMRAEAARRGYYPRYDVVQRASLDLMQTSGAYGCVSDSYTADAESLEVV